MNESSKTDYLLVGGGLAGALCGCYLGKRNLPTRIFELRDDMRGGNIPGGRSINLALSTRGIEALKPVGLADRVLEQAVPMKGRMIHDRSGELSYQPYGVRGEAINSVSRGGLNVQLLEAADEFDSVSLAFNQKCIDVDLDAPSATFENTKTGETTSESASVLLSADGAFSAVRHAMQRTDRFNYSQSYLQHGYKELSIPAKEGGGFRLEPGSLHIWPRESFMMIALPNCDGSFTCTLFWPFEGRNSFGAVSDERDLLNLFEREFADAIPHMPTLTEDYFANPTGSLVTIRCAPWIVEDRVALLGDACHAVVPFYGQGMNCAFEDVRIFAECLDAAGNRKRAFVSYQNERKKNADALADLAVANFVEMRDHTGSAAFLWKKKLEKLIAKMLPNWYIPLYSMVSFSNIPYAEAVERANHQNFVVRIAIGVLIVLLGIAVGFMLG